MKSNWIKRVSRAVLPVSIVEGVAMAICLPAVFYVAHNAMLKPAPQITVYAETVYPPQVERNSFFFLAYDLSFDSDCVITTTRILRTSDGSEINIGSDRLEVVKDKRQKYVVQIPIPETVPLGSASIRSDMAYACDFWSRYVSERHVKGYPRVLEIVLEGQATHDADVSSYKLSWLPEAVELPKPRVRKTLPAGG